MHEYQSNSVPFVTGRIIPGARKCGNNTLCVPVPATRLRSVVVPVNPGTRVMYLVNLMSVPQDPSFSNKVLPEQEGSPLARLLLLASKKKEDGEENYARFVSGDYSVLFPAELKTAWNYASTNHPSPKLEASNQGNETVYSLRHNVQIKLPPYRS